MSGPYGAAHVPYPFDVILDGHGYRLLDSVESHPFGTHRAAYAYTPTFLPRTNVQGDYGDNEQEFWHVFSQRDWSLGEGQRYYRSSDENSVRRYWQGTNLDVSRPGQVKLREEVTTATAAAAPQAVADGSSVIWFATATNLYSMAAGGTITDHGAHGVGATPFKGGMVADETGDVYITSPSGGAVGVRKWNGTSFSTFSASASRYLEFLNNSLYGFHNGALWRWDSAGTRATLFEWKGADGAVAATWNTAALAAIGGDLAIMIAGGASGRTELHLFDGVAPAKTADFPINFEGYDMEVMYGITFVSGRFKRRRTAAEYLPAIYYYASGTIGLLWTADDWTTSDVKTAVNTFGSWIVFNDDTRGVFFAYSLESGGVHSFGSFTVAGDTPVIACSSWHMLHSRNQTTMYRFPSSTIASTGTLKTSLFDGESSLTKHFQSVKVDVDIPTGATVDLAYRVNDLDGSYTSIQTGVVAGVEYTIPTDGVQGRSISIQVTLNKGSSTVGPTLKRIYVRAIPILQSFKRREYILDCTGRDGEGMIQLRDGEPHNLDGHEMAQNLIAAAELEAPFEVIDRFGTITNAIIETDAFQLIEMHPEEYVALVRVREA